MKTILKIVMIVILIVFLFAGAYYLNILDGIGASVSTINNDFIPFLPVEYRVFISILLLGLMIAIAYAFIKD